MALAPSETRTVKLVVIAENSAPALTDFTLLRYLQSVAPQIVVLIGRFWIGHLTKVGEFHEALVADRLEQLRRRGTRIYIIDPTRSRTLQRIQLPRDETVEVREDLQLRVDGLYMMFGARPREVSPILRLGMWTRARLGVRPPVGAEEKLEAFTKTALELAERQSISTVVFADAEPLIQFVNGVKDKAYTIASPGDWSAHGRVLEYRFGRWALSGAEVAAEVAERSVARDLRASDTSAAPL